MLGTSLTIAWQDLAAWLTVALAAAYLVRHFRRGERGRLGNCAGCSHCPMLPETQK